MSFIPALLGGIGSLFGLFGAGQQASASAAAQKEMADAAQQAAQGQTQLLDTIRQIVNQNLAQYSQYYQPLLGPIANQMYNVAQGIPFSDLGQYDILQLLQPQDQLFQLLQGQAYGSNLANAQNAIEMLAQNPDTVAQLPQQAQAIAENLLQSDVGASQQFAIQENQDWLNQLQQALNTAGTLTGTAADFLNVGQSGIVPGAVNTLSNMANTYGQAGAAAQNAWASLMKQPSPFTGAASTINSFVSNPNIDWNSLFSSIIPNTAPAVPVPDISGAGDVLQTIGAAGF